MSHRLTNIFFKGQPLALEFTNSASSGLTSYYPILTIFVNKSFIFYATGFISYSSKQNSTNLNLKCNTKNSTTVQRLGDI